MVSLPSSYPASPVATCRREERLGVQAVDGDLTGLSRWVALNQLLDLVDCIRGQVLLTALRANLGLDVRDDVCRIRSMSFPER